MLNLLLDSFLSALIIPIQPANELALQAILNQNINYIIYPIAYIGFFAGNIANYFAAYWLIRRPFFWSRLSPEYLAAQKIYRRFLPWLPLLSCLPLYGGIFALFSGLLSSRHALSLVFLSLASGFGLFLALHL